MQNNNSTFRKVGHPDALRAEAAKLELAVAISERTGYFEVPKVKAVDDESITLAHIENLVPLRKAILRRLVDTSVARKIGRSLGSIHRWLHLPDQLRTPLPEGLRWGSSDVAIHGDFSGENVCLGPDCRVVVLDWSMTPRYGGMATVGTRYFDISWFLCNLFRRPIYQYLRGGRLDRIADDFLDGYRAECSEFELNDLIAYHRKFYRFRMEHRSPQERWIVKRMLLAYGFDRWNQYIEGKASVIS